MRGIALIAAAVALSLPAAARAGWSAPVSVPQTGPAGVGFDAAGDGRGHIAALATFGPTLDLAVPKRRLSFTVRRVAVALPDDLRVAVDRAGGALIVWRYDDESIPAPAFSREDDCCERVVAEYRTPGGAIRGPTIVSPPNADSTITGVAAGRPGTAAVAWRTQPYFGLPSFPAVQVAVAENGRLQPAKTLAVEQQQVTPAVGNVAVDDRGRVSAEWVVAAAHGDALMEQVRRGRWSAPRVALRLTVTHFYRDPMAVRLASDGRGDQLAVWVDRHHGRLLYSRRRAGRGFGAHHLLAEGAGFAVPETALADDGGAVAEWSRFGEVGSPVRVSVALPGRSFGAVRQLPLQMGLDNAPSVAMDLGGRAFVAYVRDTATVEAATGRGGAMRGHAFPATRFPARAVVVPDRRGGALAFWDDGVLKAARFRP